MVLNTGSIRKITDMYFAKLDSVSLSVCADGIGTIEVRLRAPLIRDQLIERALLSVGK